MATSEDIRKVIEELPFEEGDRAKILENIHELTKRLEALNPIEYARLPRVQEEVGKIMAYARERQVVLAQRSNIRKWGGRLLPAYGLGLGALGAIIEMSPHQTDTTYLERLMDQPSGSIMVTFLVLAVYNEFFARKKIDEASQRLIDDQVYDALADEIGMRKKESTDS